VDTETNYIFLKDVLLQLMRAVFWSSIVGTRNRLGLVFKTGTTSIIWVYCNIF